MALEAPKSNLRRLESILDHFLGFSSLKQDPMCQYTEDEASLSEEKQEQPKPTSCGHGGRMTLPKGHGASMHSHGAYMVLPGLSG